MAMAKFPDNTILVRLGKIRLFSDITGVYLLDMDGSIKAREHLARRLETCGCDVIDLNADHDWQTAGDFSVG